MDKHTERRQLREKPFSLKEISSGKFFTENEEASRGAIAATNGSPSVGRYSGEVTCFAQEDLVVGFKSSLVVNWCSK